MRSSDLARTWRRSKSTSNLARCACCKVTAAHDVGRAINPTLIEGQIEGGVAQGLGMALMEEFFPGQGREPARLSDSVGGRRSAGGIDSD